MTEYLELADAARRMGLTSEALKKRLIRGTVPGQKIGGRWMVAAPGACHDVSPSVTTRDDDHHDAGVTPSPQPSELAKALDVIERQQQTIMELSGRVGYLMGQTEELRGRIALLEAPKTADPAPETAPATGPASSSDSSDQAPIRRPWWAFWRQPPAGVSA